MAKAKRFLKAIMALTLSALSCFSVVACQSTPTDKPTDEAQEVFYDGFIGEVKESEGISLRMTKDIIKEPNRAPSFIPTETRYSLIAEVEGEGLFNDELVWEMNFKNPDSEWAQGKDLVEYMELGVSDDTHSAYVVNDTAFGEPIIVRVTSVDNPAKSAVCQLDFVKRIKSVSVASCYTSANETTPNSCSGDNCIVVIDNENEIDAYANLSLNVELGVGTVTPTVRNSGSFYVMENALGVSSFIRKELGISTSFGPFDGELVVDDGTFDGTNYTAVLRLSLETFGLPTADKNVNSNAIHNYFRDYAEDYTYQLYGGLIAEYNGVVYYANKNGMNGYTTEFYDEVKICTCNMKTRASATNVAFDKTNFVF